ncbi:MAG: peptide chain release factor N(5)-glutamine methyltransferase [Pseudomonadota bacterium]
MPQVRELLARATELPGAEARREAEVLLGHSLGKPRSWLYAWPEAEVGEAERAHFERLLDARASGQPIAYLTGRREFWSLDLAVSPATLIPRPETETLVQWALELPLTEPCRALDLGTGSGAIALALLSERPAWHITGVDSSKDALALARDNARYLELGQLEFLQSDWFAQLEGRRFELLVSNPPYVADSDPHLSRGDLRFEPRSALAAKKSGLADLQLIISQASGYLERPGWLLLEHGYEQGAPVRDMLGAAGFVEVETRLDAAGLERVTGGRLC